MQAGGYEPPVFFLRKQASRFPLQTETALAIVLGVTIAAVELNAINARPAGRRSVIAHMHRASIGDDFENITTTRTSP
jgi:hypothetical protein